MTLEDGVFVGHGVMFINDLHPRAVNADGSLQTDADWTLVPTLVEAARLDRQQRHDPRRRHHRRRRAGRRRRGGDPRRAGLRGRRRRAGQGRRSRQGRARRRGCSRFVLTGADQMIGIAVVGYGYWGPNLVRNFWETPGARLVSVCDLQDGAAGRRAGAAIRRSRSPTTSTRC